jgi:hypothetical protein
LEEPCHGRNKTRCEGHFLRGSGATFSRAGHSLSRSSLRRGVDGPSTPGRPSSASPAPDAASRQSPSRPSSSIRGVSSSMRRYMVHSIPRWREPLWQRPKVAFPRAGAPDLGRFLFSLASLASQLRRSVIREGPFRSADSVNIQCLH